MRVLMVCLGNICRSPLAEGILRARSLSAGLDWEVDSAGTSRYHEGETPDPRSIEIARKSGLDISQLKARQFSAPDFDRFDLILVMDRKNLLDVRRQALQVSHLEKVHLLLDYLYPGSEAEVPDPYYSGKFEETYALLDKACLGLVRMYAPVPAGGL